jgi:hypothetical protein
MKTIIKLVIAALIVHATWRAGSVYLRYFEFRDDVQQIAQFAGRQTDAELRKKVFEAAEVHGIALPDDAATVRRLNNHLLIDATYTEQIELLPRYFYPWQFKMNVDVLTVTL